MLALLTLLQRNLSGPIVLLNLLKLRDAADYSEFPDLDPGELITGRAAYAKRIGGGNGL